MKPIIYQVLTRLFGNRNSTNKEWGTIKENGVGKMNDFDDVVLGKIKGLGATHVWFTGVIRHASQTDYTRHGVPCQHPDVVKGIAGSPYAITDYYDIDPDIAVDTEHRMGEWQALVERTHRAGLKVVMDFVPNHVAREYKSICKPDGVKDLGEGDNTDYHFSRDNNFYYINAPLDLSCIENSNTKDGAWRSASACSELRRYEEMPARATGNDVFSAAPSRNDWYETVKLNYGIDYCDAGGRSEHFSPIPDTWLKMADILLFWAQTGVDAFRCDMAEMVPAEFWTWATERVKIRYPEVRFIGEVYNPAEYRKYISAGFNWLYDKVGMYDCVREVMCGRRSTSDITAQWQQTDDILGNMLYFLENHDEQRIASDFFAADARRGIPGLIVCALFNTSPFMLYAGQEFGERGMDKEGFSGRDGRTTIFDYWCVDTLRRGYFNRMQLSEEEKTLEASYRRILTLANSEPAVSEGLCYDLMYANRHIADRQFAFLRRHGRETLLVASNFDDMPQECDITIPRHAFDFLKIEEGTYHAVDLLTDNATELSLEADRAVRIAVPPLGGVVLKMQR
ncbi:MAG: alpha-amylase family glycosyl hydrolase [Prevotella sp.]|uniref:alpha-amylase family glycosyl hydrolase n=1 Tax=Prevotella sp. TaxID=59823 RepID=UPI002A2B3D0C|nr:alpha-amylase family glycosyl hydrolase [Prevotella sp.]MDD7317675.1 alpha-amylase family glycosyl hydrolase [Prevotellaceae bacterium]MDY4020478.1 alpha-amylase family glycosyl hydrolase [Prevotella sp.]